MDAIRATKGVENVVLTQRDGNPIQYSGIWLSEEEIFSISASTSAIYNCGLSMHHEKLKYILIEGKTAKIMITPLRNYGNSTIEKIIQSQNLQKECDEFYIAITTRANVNLGGIFLKIRQSLINIKKCLILSGESFKPPQRKYTAEEMRKMFEKSSIREEVNRKDNIPIFSFSLSANTYDILDNILKEFSKNTLDLIHTYITFEGGFILSKYFNSELCNPDQVEKDATLSDSLFKTADKCAWLLKNMHVKSILLECIDEFQFINLIKNSIFSAKVQKGRQKLGLLRLIIPKYCAKIENAMIEAEKLSTPDIPIKIENLFSEISL